MNLIIFFIAAFTTISSQTFALGETYFIGKIEKIPVCPNTRCITCSRAESVPAGQNCIPCPICGPKNNTCPLYRCSSCTQGQLYDDAGCAVCTPCKKPQVSGNASNNCAEPECDECSEKRTPIQAAGSRCCTECRAQSHITHCPQILCPNLRCNYGHIFAVTEDCCLGCAKCQPHASSECKDIRCGSTETQCPDGSHHAEQYDSNGCQLCPTCRRGCPLFKCALPACDACSELFTPVRTDGCNGCPQCGVKPNLPPLRVCNYVRLQDRQCQKSFAYVATDSQGCCRVSANECQVGPHCPNVYCKPLECGSNLAAIDRFDANGCKICPVCPE